MLNDVNRLIRSQTTMAKKAVQAELERKRDRGVCRHFVCAFYLKSRLCGKALTSAKSPLISSFKATLRTRIVFGLKLIR